MLKKTTEYFLNFFLFFYLKVQSFRLIMANNFIQMTASASHAYAIGTIFMQIIDCVFNYWELPWIDIHGASRTLSAAASVFSSVRAVFGFLLLFFKNPHTIFARILQHYHDFQSNVAIFSSVIQAYTKPYAFIEKIKLIICWIRYELSVTIHEINTSWKKNFMRDPI